MTPLLRVAFYRFRATFGRRWPGYATIILLIGLVGGLAMGAIPGARRTQSSFPVYAANLFARDIHAVPLPSVPILRIVFIALGALVLANVVAAIPGRFAARTPTALVLRAEENLLLTALLTTL